jgi:hypothetical protein
MLAKVVAYVLNNCLTLCDYNVLVGASRPDADSRRLAKRMDDLQFWACALVLVALVNFDVILEIQLFEQPDDALTAGLVEPVLWSAGREGRCVDVVWLNQ